MGGSSDPDGGNCYCSPSIPAGFLDFLDFLERKSHVALRFVLCLQRMLRKPAPCIRTPRCAAAAVIIIIVIIISFLDSEFLPGGIWTANCKTRSFNLQLGFTAVRVTREPFILSGTDTAIDALSL